MVIRNVTVLLMTVMVLSGCALFMVGAGAVANRQVLAQGAAKNKERLKQLEYGISKKFVLKVMGRDPIRAYRGDVKVAYKNPYRSEILIGKRRAFELLYYITDVKDDNGFINNDELTPLVFENGKIIGWGWDFLRKNVDR